MYQTISKEAMAALAQIDTPSICNAIEGFEFRPRNEGFMLPEVKGVFRDLPAVCGYAVTGVMSAQRAEARYLQGNYAQARVYEHLSRIQGRPRGERSSREA